MEPEGFLLVEVFMRWRTWSLGRTFPSFIPLIQFVPNPLSHNDIITFAPLLSTLVRSASVKDTWRVSGDGFMNNTCMVGKG